MSTSSTRAAITTAPRVASGRLSNTPVKSNSVNTVRSAANSPESWVRAPAEALIAVFDKLPLTTIPLESPAARLAAAEPERARGWRRSARARARRRSSRHRGPRRTRRASRRSRRRQGRRIRRGRRPGRPSEGRPISIGPTIAISSSSVEELDRDDREQDDDQRSRDRGRHPPEPENQRERAAPTARVVPCVSPRSPGSPIPARRSRRRRPRRRTASGSVPTMIVSARPTMKPLSTGSEMKLARNPSRSRPATSAATPTHERQAPRSAWANASPLPATTSPTTAAESAAVAAIGPRPDWRELPKAA